MFYEIILKCDHLLQLLVARNVCVTPHCVEMTPKSDRKFYNHNPYRFVS